MPSAPLARPSTEFAMRALARFFREHGAAFALISAVLLIPCFWHAHIQAGDLGSHVYNAWLAQLIERHQVSGLAIAGQWNNILFDLMLLRAGDLFGFAAGQLVPLALLVRGVARALPAATDESAQLLPAFVEYKLLAWSAFAYYVSIWADKVVVYIVRGADAAAFYAAIAAVAWFSVIPAFAWIYVQVETAFYQRFRSFYAELEGGAPLRELKQHAERISDEAKRILRGAAAVQIGATTLVIAAAPRIVHAVGLSPDAGPLFRLAALGAGAQVFCLLEVLLLTYFDLRRDAMVICGCLLGGVTALTCVCAAIGWPPVIGHLVACAISAVVGLVLVRRRLQTLVLDTFQSQPFGVA